MLNINQNFDLKAPVFNFDRDYFNSVKELNAYDTSNVPNHFVTNVGGMLYQFTDGKWLPMINTEYEDETQHYVNLGCTNAWLEIDTKNDVPFNLCLSNASGYSILSPTELNINNDEYNCNTTITDTTISCGDDFVRVYVYGNEGRVEASSTSGDYTNYGTLGLEGCSGDNSKQFSLSIPNDDDKNGEVSLSLKNADRSTKLTDSGLTVTSDEGFTTSISNQTFSIQLFNNPAATLQSNKLLFFNDDHTTALKLGSTDGLVLGSGDKVKFSRPTNDEGGVISGIKSLTAFANPSATKVWATDGSTVDLTTKANASDVLLKKSASGGYYIGSNSNQLGLKAFAANYSCNPTGERSHAEGGSTDALGAYSHAEGGSTQAVGAYSHAQGTYNVHNINAIHSIGIGNSQIRKNSEFVYFNSDTDPKNGYKYLIGVGGYDGISTDNTTYKSVQEVIADLTARIEQLETKVRALEAANTPA